MGRALKTRRQFGFNRIKKSVDRLSCKTDPRLRLRNVLAGNRTKLFPGATPPTDSYRYHVAGRSEQRRPQSKG